MPDQDLQPIPNGTITTPKGFSAGAVYAGLKTPGPDKLDLALLYSEAPCSVAGVFTTNRVVSPTVTLSRGVVARQMARAIVVNAGCANTSVGPKGMQDALEMASLAAARLGIKPEEALVASTGVIGVRLKMPLLRSALPKIEVSHNGGHSFARAIITTDTHTKEVAFSFEAGGKKCAIGGVAKGAGMIHPNMATLLSFIATDASVEPGLLRTALERAVDRSFNMVTVDGDTSTNDMVILLANGEAGNRRIESGSPDEHTFQEALDAVCLHLAKEIAGDGEGATRLIEVAVEGAASLADARAAARTIAGSNLLKSAVYGNDPNWGRVLAALGRSGAAVDEGRVALYINDICVMDSGIPVAFSEEAASASLKAKTVNFRVRLGLGESSATAWGCDLTEQYVKINSEYTT